ncbi:putative RTA1 domain protein [Mytilinidion resinicola]|uniref:RTA1 domain protein n=1 Tax=Mytilinidion resinicola TaxID=574789 RepID=A0A6A6YYH7_9PEZI|nr:putative RTA1 domain protein [Mytilinidion resinicola]KAF2813054.1 putative RTA1 domain protein [Mytilinidion resinicola]
MFPSNITFTNQTLINNTDLCTLDTCPMYLANFTYVPSLAGNVLYAVIFGIILIAQIYLGIRKRTWGYLAGMFGGLLLEIIGYAGRIQLHFNPFPFNPFLENLICLTIAPAFLSAAIYLTLGRVIVIYGPPVSPLKPRTYSIIFVSCDLLSLILQSAGGAITATADTGDQTTHDLGVHIMIAGLIFQVVSLCVFMALCAAIWLRIWRHPDLVADESEKLSALRKTRMWRVMLWALAAATVFIIVRSIFRVAELWGGFNGSLANNEAMFMVFEGAMLVIACSALTVGHPGVCFDGHWADGNWTFKTKKGGKDEEAAVPLSQFREGHYKGGYRGMGSHGSVSATA